MAEIQNTAQTTGNQLGNVGGMSKTIINDYLCTKSFEEHGTLMVLGVVRIKDTHIHKVSLECLCVKLRQTSTTEL